MRKLYDIAENKNWARTPRSWFNINTPSCQYKVSHCGYKIVLWLSYHYHLCVQWFQECPNVIWMQILFGIHVGIGNAESIIACRKYNFSHLAEQAPSEYTTKGATTLQRRYACSSVLENNGTTTGCRFNKNGSIPVLCKPWTRVYGRVLWVFSALKICMSYK